MGLFIILFGGLMINLIANELTQSNNANLQSKLMDKQLDNQSQLNEESFNRSAEFWKDNQSPAALMDQYKSLGASETAALQSILGLSPSSPISPTAGTATGANPATMSTLPQMLDSLQNMINSKVGNENTVADTENKILQNMWLPTMNTATLDSMYGHLQIDAKKLGLDRDIFEQVTKPLAQSTINLNSVQIEEKQQNIKNLATQRLQILQQIKTLQAQERNLDTSSDLMAAQRNYTVVQTGQAQAQTGLIQQQTLTEEQETQLKELENRLKSLDVELSEACGSNLTLPWQNVGLESGIRTDLNYQIAKTEAFNQAVDAACNEAKHVLQLLRSWRPSKYSFSAL